MGALNLNLGRSALFWMIGEANEKGAPHSFVQSPAHNSKAPGSIRLVWQPEMGLPGGGQVEIVLDANGTWAAYYEVPGA